MKVLVIGAHGQIGRITMAKLVQNNYQATAGLRKNAQITAYQSQGYLTALVDVTRDIDSLEAAMQNQDAVIFAVGSGGNTGADRTMMVDLDGAVKTIEAAKQAQIKHFIMISAIGAGNRQLWSYGQQELSTGNYYYAAKYYADEWLIHSGLNYTIIRPAALTNEAASGQVDLAAHLDLMNAGQTRTISRSDVAQTIIESLKQPTAINQIFDLSQGQTPIAQAIAQLS